MVYARCLYRIAMWADPHQRTAHTVTRVKIAAFLHHACRLLQCRLVSVGIGPGYVMMLVDLNVNISIGAFIDNLKSWTSTWITVGDASEYWSHAAFDEVSPEDGASVAAFIQSANAETLAAFVPPSMSADPCHHIILLTSRFRLLIPLNYRGVLSDIAADAARSLSAEVVAASAMRNHVHLLCGVPADISISGFVDQLKASVFERSQANRHLRCIEGWSDHSVSHTVSASRIEQEEHDVRSQDDIHWRRRRFDEMSPLYQRLGIPYVASLH